jgi:methylenetetrahydrofolate--tRNA-(uracil-5-)-methyltransferase
MTMSKSLMIIGGGLAGSEAAWQAAQRGIQVKLYEMRPAQSTGAHVTSNLAELVCSNSFGTSQIERGSGLLQEELHRLGSLLVECARQTAVPAGGSLAVDRIAFSELVTEKISSHPGIEFIREEVLSVPNEPTVIASGPLTSPSLSNSIKSLTGQSNLFFFDAIAPIVTLESIDFTKAFRASRYRKGMEDDTDFVNCPLDRSEYQDFVQELRNAERIQLREFESQIQVGVNAGDAHFFEGCLPVEILANRDPNSLAYGPMRPTGLRNPHTGKRPYAVLQLRQDNIAGSLYNLVGFQTNLTFTEQKRVLRSIPGLEKAEFARYGQMHRNTFIASPSLLKPTLQTRDYADLFYAGQITGVEGYLGNIATGWLAGVNAARFLRGERLLEFPQTTMLGALCHYITHADLKTFQPMKSNFGILTPLEESSISKHERFLAFSTRALKDLDQFLLQNHIAATEKS